MCNEVSSDELWCELLGVAQVMLNTSGVSCSRGNSPSEDTKQLTKFRDWGQINTQKLSIVEKYRY